MSKAEQEAEDRKLEVERERLELERRRFSFEQRFTNRHLGLILTTLVSVATVAVAGGQIWVAQFNKEREMKVAELEQERQWKLKLAQFIIDNKEEIFSEDARTSARIRDVIIVAFPPEFARVVVERRQLVSDGSAKGIWDVGRLYILTLQGRLLTATDAKILEARLNENPVNSALRVELIAHYSFSGSETDKQREHVRWLIQNDPENRFLEGPIPYVGLGDLNEFAKLWSRQCEVKSNRPAVLVNAASFFSSFKRDFQTAEVLLRRAKVLDPDNLRTRRDLGLLLVQQGGGRELDALGELEEALNKAPRAKQFFLLGEVAKAAFDANEDAKAANYASQLLNQAAQNRESFEYGNAIHVGNIVLGRVELRRGKLKEAKEHLIRAATTPGSPQLDSFGPNMSLARDLLSIGERDVVLTYLDLCERLWTHDLGQLRKWKEDINKGKIPNFGPNLYY